MHGLLGRLTSGLGYAAVVFGAANTTGVVNLLPLKVAGPIIVVGGFVSLISERIQGGASKASVRIAAAASDNTAR